MKNETPINGYDFSLKKEELKKIFNTPDYQEYKAKARKTQKRKETIYKFTSILNSTNSVRFLIIANVILFIVSFYFLQSMFTYFASYPITHTNFAIWQPLTSMFLHGGFLHILFNMFVLWQFGNRIEETIGTNKFLSLYFISGIVSGLLWLLFGTGAAVGASGALCGLLAAYVFISPETKVLLFFIIPMKIKNLVYGFMLFSFVFGILSIINPTFGFGIAHFGHLGGLVGGYLLTYFWKIKKLIPTY